MIFSWKKDTGLDIRITGKVFSSKTEAISYLKKNYENWNMPIAVQYFPLNEKMVDYKAKVRKTETLYKNIIKKTVQDFFNRKSRIICPGCKQAYKREYLQKKYKTFKVLHCNICNHNLLGYTNLRKIHRAKKKIVAIKDKFDSLTQLQEVMAELIWICCVNKE
jgi:hypothetical protein